MVKFKYKTKLQILSPGSSAVERTAVNRKVEGSKAPFAQADAQNAHRKYAYAKCKGCCKSFPGRLMGR